jgi:hypothetical protein
MKQPSVHMGARDFWRTFADSLIMKVVEKVGVPLLLLLGGLMLATGQSMVGSVMEKKAMAAMQPKIGSLTEQIDSLKTEVSNLKSEIGLTKKEQWEFFGAQMDADPKLWSAVKRRAAHNLATTAQKKETEELLKNLSEEEAP